VKKTLLAAIAVLLFSSTALIAGTDGRAPRQAPALHRAQHSAALQPSWWDHLAALWAAAGCLGPSGCAAAPARAVAPPPAPNEVITGTCIDPNGVRYPCNPPWGPPY
jgi:hypothetical protein